MAISSLKNILKDCIVPYSSDELEALLPQLATLIMNATE